MEEAGIGADHAWDVHLQSGGAKQVASGLTVVSWTMLVHSLGNRLQFVGCPADLQHTNRYYIPTCRRFWPDEGHRWIKGIITDYNREADELCIIYYMNTAHEEWEWVRLRCGLTGPVH